MNNETTSGGTQAATAQAASPRRGWKALLPDACAVVLFLLLSLAYFITPISQGMVLGGHDSVASIGQGQEQVQYRERTGEVTRWTNSMFSGMPTYQIAPSYGPTDLLSTLSHAYGLGTTGALSYVFLYLLGFYILMRAFNFKPWLSALGAVVWAFSSYFFIIIAAGHIWKVLTLAFIPPTIAGLVLCYRGKYLWGGAVTALFTALQVLSNHLQMTYYFLFVMLFIVVAYGVDAIVRKKLAHFGKATATVLVAGILGVLANLPNLYHTYQYSQESMRGRAELSPQAAGKGTQAQAATSGLDRDYITQWSYGIGETMTLMIPNYKGGGSGSVLDLEDVEQKPGFDGFYQGAGATQQLLQESGAELTLPGINQYWGDQPFTVGPVYVGALVCFLFLLGAFYVRGPLKWALLASTLLSLLFAWGKNWMPVTDFFIDYLPMYSKFRTVSSALVIAEFCMPLLAMLALAEIIRQPGRLREKPAGAAIAFALTAGVCLVLWMCPSVAGNCLSDSEAYTLRALRAVMPADVAASYSSGITAMRHSILQSDALRSLLFILLGAGCILLYMRRTIKGWLLCSALTVICLIDMWGVNKRYLNTDSFSDPVQQLDAIATKTAADEQILQDKDLSYRVMNLGAGNPFNETSNQTSYWHKSIGGYHAAKLHRYQDLIDRVLMDEISAFAQAANTHGGDLSAANGDSIMPVLNMLNMKYAIFGAGAQAIAVPNPHANGNGWFVERISFVKNADAEMERLKGLDTKRQAVADERFKAVLDAPQLGQGSVKLTKYEPNELRYDIASDKGGVVVFSEIYYPGWTATIDGKPAELGRADYVLRALRVPAGSHKVVLEFRPASVSTTEAIAYAALALIVLGFLFALLRQTGWRKGTGRTPKGV